MKIKDLIKSGARKLREALPYSQYVPVTQRVPGRARYLWQDPNVTRKLPQGEFSTGVFSMDPQSIAADKRQQDAAKAAAAAQAQAAGAAEAQAAAEYDVAHPVASPTLIPAAFAAYNPVSSPAEFAQMLPGGQVTGDPKEMLPNILPGTQATSVIGQTTPYTGFGRSPSQMPTQVVAQPTQVTGQPQYSDDPSQRSTQVMAQPQQQVPIQPGGAPPLPMPDPREPSQRRQVAHKNIRGLVLRETKNVWRQ